jgi:glycosyltransferase involved in cell wall biosynthesis
VKMSNFKAPESAVFVTDSTISREGHGGGVVSYHELNALKSVSDVSQIYQRVGRLFFEDYYPQNPFMYDYFIASLLKEPEKVDLAHFYGASFNLVTKRLYRARKFATVPAHDLGTSLQEWTSQGFWSPPPPHLTDDSLFRYLCAGLHEVTVVCPSTASARFLKSKLNLDSVIIPHGTDIPERFNIDRPQFNVFHLSQFGPDKGQIYLLKAWKKFQKGKLTMCCSNIIDSLVQGIPNLTVSKFVTEPEKESLYENASVYVQPSVTEGWGLEVGEAMSHGTPVIVTEGVGAADMVVDGREGFIVPIRDPDAITNALIYYNDNPKEVRRMGHNARITAEKYSWGIIESKYAKLFREGVS